MVSTIIAAAEQAEEAAAVNPFVIGGAALAILFALLFVLLVFGKGREHT